MALDTELQTAQAAFDGVEVATEVVKAAPPATEAATKATPQPAQKPEVSAKTAVKPDWESEKQKLIDDYNKQLEEVRRKADAANGKYGATKQKLDRLLAEQASIEAEANKKKVDADVENWKEFAETYPDLAAPIEARHAALEAKIKQLEGMLPKSEAQTQANADEPPNDGAPDIDQEREQKIAIKLFKQLHPDHNSHAWSVMENGVSVMKFSPDFEKWLGTLTDEERNKTIESWDVGFTTQQFTKFKQWTSERQSGAAIQKAKSQQRVQGAVVPNGSKGGISSVISAQEAFDAAT